MKRRSRLYIEGIGLLLCAVLGIIAMTESGVMPDPTMPAGRHQSSQAGTLTVYDAEKASPGLTLFPVTGTAEVLLLSMQGQVLHRWNVDAERARLLPDGSLLVIHGSDWGKDRKPWSELRQTLRRYAWDGSVVWEYESDDVIHHDARILPSGNILFLQRALVPAEKKEKIFDTALRGTEMRADSIIEITPEGTPVWQWHAYDHLDLNSCGRRECRDTKEGRASHKSKDWTHGNTAALLPPNKWYEAGDERFAPGNILFFPRNWWTAFLLDRRTGDIVWQYGGDYRGGLSGGHEISMIPDDLPGAGNMLMIDNGTSTHKGESFVLEFNPVSKELVWVYDAGKAFHTRTRGSVQRLPNGNTLISEDERGRVFEVTPDKNIVWEFQGTEEVSRARRYPLSYCPRCAAALQAAH